MSLKVRTLQTVCLKMLWGLSYLFTSFVFQSTFFFRSVDAIMLLMSQLSFPFLLLFFFSLWHSSPMGRVLVLRPAINNVSNSMTPPEDPGWHLHCQMSSPSFKASLGPTCLLSVLRISVRGRRLLGGCFITAGLVTDSWNEMWFNNNPPFLLCI